MLEYNVRGGDPETLTLLPLLSQDSDLAEVMVACTEHCLDGVDLKIEPKYAATVVAAAEGYPGSYHTGTEISLDDPEEGWPTQCCLDRKLLKLFRYLGISRGYYAD